MRSTVRALAIAALVLVAVAATEDATPAAAKESPSILAGGDLPRPLTLAVEDSLALWFPPDVDANIATLPGWPSRLETPPANPGTGYNLSSQLELWLIGGSTHALWRDVKVGDGRQPGAIYYPAVSAIVIRVGDDPPRWARLDEDRARLLNRYIELGRSGALPEQPSILDVLAAEARAGRPTPFTVDGHPLSPPAAEAFWRLAASTAWTEELVYASLIGVHPYTGAPAEFDQAVEAMVYGFPTPIWLAFDIDGREVKLAYYPTTGAIAGIPPPNSSAWIGRGFVIPPELREAFHASLGLPPVPPPFTSAAAAAPAPRGESLAASASDGRFGGRAGTTTALALLGLVGLAAVASAALVRGMRRRQAA